MKKVKIMLMSLLILAGVGGALAFKAKSDGDFCWAATIEVGGVAACPTNGANARICQDLIEAVETTTAPALVFSCTTTLLVVNPG